MLNKMAKPIWLASFPKSGNTWVRLFLTALLKDKDPDINEIETDGIISERHVIDKVLGINSANIPESTYLKYRSELYHNWASSQNKEFLLTKVHDSCIREGFILFPPSITRGVVYILRNPFDMAASLANHNNTSIKTSVNTLCNSNNIIANKKSGLGRQISQFLGSWSDHVESWTKVHHENMILIRYEDMLHNGQETFRQLVNYLELDYSTDEINRAIENTSFKKVKEKELTGDFKERPKDTKAFFRSGKSGGWREEITSDQVKMIIDKHYETLLKYNYIDEKGAVLI